MRQFAAQVQAVLGAIQAVLFAVANGVDHLLQIIQPVAAVTHVADPNRIQHGSNAVGHHQRIVAAHRRVGRPVHLRTWGKEFVEVIGVQLDHPRHQPAAFAVDRARQLACGVRKSPDHAVFTGQRAVDHFIFQNQFDVIDDHKALPVTGFITCRRLAIRSRTALSWKIPTMAAPRSRACSIRLTTAALLVLSSEAVGSSSSNTG